MDQNSLARAAEAIHRALDSGKTLDEVKDFMRGAGYTEEDISQVLAQYSDNPPAGPPQKRFCTNCGKPIEMGELFCTECGNRLKLPEPEPLQQPKLRYCPTCRDPVRDSEIFCDKCGRKLREPPADKKTGHSRKFVIALALCSLALILAAVFIFIYMNAERGPYAYGFVYDYSDRPLGNVLVSVGDTNYRTNAAGDFNISVGSGTRKVITFEKDGFAPIHKIIPADLKKNVYYKIQMPELAKWVSIKQDSYYPGSVKGKNAEISFEKNSFGKGGTNETPSNISISLTRFDPADDQDKEAFPGEFETVMSGQNVGLESFGFAKLLVEDNQGNELELSSNKTAKIKMKISGNGEDAPDEMPLWYFDENKGYWTYKSVAKKVGNSYSGYYYEGTIDTVGSWWNCDRSFERSWFEFLFGDLVEDFSGLDWELIWNIAGVIYEPIDWAHSIWTLMDPESSTLDRIAAVVSFLPLLNNAAAEGLIRTLDDAISLPTLERLLSREGAEMVLDIAGELYAPIGTGTDFVTLMNPDSSIADRIEAAISLFGSAQEAFEGRSNDFDAAVENVMQNLVPAPSYADYIGYTPGSSPPSTIELGDQSPINFEYDPQGYPTRWSNGEYEVSIDYSADHTSGEMTAVELDGGDSYTESIDYSAEDRSLTTTNPSTGVSSNLVFDRYLRITSGTIRNSESTATYTSGWYGNTLLVSPLDPNSPIETIQMRQGYDDNTDRVTLTMDLDYGQESYRLEEIAGFDQSGRLTYREEEYFNGTGYYPPTVYRQTASYTYSNISDSGAPGAGAGRLSLMTGSIEYPGLNKKLSLTLDLSNTYSGYDELPPDSSVGNDYISLKTDSGSRISESYMYSGLLSRIGIQDAPSYITMAYDQSGSPSSANLPDGSVAVPVYDSSGNLIDNQITTPPIDPQEGEKLEAFLSDLGIDDTMFKARVDGVGYTYKGEVLFDPLSDNKVTVGARNQSKAKASIMAGDTSVFSMNLTAGMPGQTTEIKLGRLPIAGARVAVTLDSWYTSKVSGFLTFESADGGLFSSMPVTLNPGQTQTFKMPLPANTIGKLYFQTFDFMTSGVNVPPIQRLTMGGIDLTIPKDCANQKSVIIVFDISGSMDEQSESDPSNTKRDIEKRVLADLVRKFGGSTKYALMGFSGTPYIYYLDESTGAINNVFVSDATDYSGKRIMFAKSDESKVIEAINAIGSGSSTDIQGALIASIRIVNKTLSPDKRIILITDGASSVDFDKVEQAYNPQIEISTIGVFGTNKGAEYYDPETLTKIAQIGHGDFYEVSSYRQFYSAIQTSAKAC